MCSQQHYHPWHLQSTNQNKHPKKGYIPLSDTFSEYAAVVVVVFGAFVAPNTMLAAALPVQFAGYAVDPFLVVIILLIFKDSPCVDKAYQQVQYYLTDKDVSDHCLEGIPDIQVSLDNPIQHPIEDGPSC